MGNSHSQNRATNSRERPRTLKHHRSAPLLLQKSFINSTSTGSFSSTQSQEIYIRPTSEKAALVAAEVLLPPPAPPVYVSPPSSGIFPALSVPDQIPEKGEAAAYSAFLRAYPEYHLTWTLDALRKSEFSRVDTPHARETYVDYMGGALYPASLVNVHAEFLKGCVLGNTHSASNSSQLSANLTAQARAAVLAFFNAPPGSTVVFTANASAALKLVGECFPFSEGSTYVLPEDAHNSVHGIRQFAKRRGAEVCYISATPQGGVEEPVVKRILQQHRPSKAPCLFALTGLSNISNSKPSLSLLTYASALGYTTLLDAAALAATSPLDLTATPADAVAISFYKMFGFPTGVGALILAPGVGQRLGSERPWFAGGTVEVVQVPGELVTRAEEIEEQFEDGTINYLLLPAITTGLRFLSAYLPFLPLRLSSLTHHLTIELAKMRHLSTGQPAVRVLSRVPEKRLRAVGDKADAGSVVSVLFLDPNGVQLPNSFISHASANARISLRTGCMCNPGGAAALLRAKPAMTRLRAGATLAALEAAAGRELGVVRISLGLASDWADVWRVLEFVRDFVLDARGREEAMGAWEASEGRLKGSPCSTGACTPNGVDQVRDVRAVRGPPSEVGRAF